MARRRRGRRRRRRRGRRRWRWRRRRWRWPVVAAARGVTLLAAVDGRVRLRRVRGGGDDGRRRRRVARLLLRPYVRDARRRRGCRRIRQHRRLRRRLRRRRRAMALLDRRDDVTPRRRWLLQRRRRLALDGSKFVRDLRRWRGLRERLRRRRRHREVDPLVDDVALRRLRQWRRRRRRRRLLLRWRRLLRQLRGPAEERALVVAAAFRAPGALAVRAAPERVAGFVAEFLVQRLAVPAAARHGCRRAQAAARRAGRVLKPQCTPARVGVEHAPYDAQRLLNADQRAVGAAAPQFKHR